MFEHECHAARSTEGTAALVEIHAHAGHRAVGVVRRRFHHDRNAVRAVSFVDHLLVVGRILLRGTLDRTFDILLGHVLRFGVLDEDTQAGISRGVGSSGLDCDLDLLADLGEYARHMSPALQFSRFTVFKSSSHNFV